MSIIFYPKSCIMAWLRGYLTVGLANLTVKMGCFHYKLTLEVKRSGYVAQRFNYICIFTSRAELKNKSEILDFIDFL